MGLFRKSCYTNSSNLPVAAWSAPNPSPGLFTIKRAQMFVTLNSYATVAEINYTGCTNYEGNKICVFEGITPTELRKRKEIDPHFADSKYAPVARFKPDAQGWERACKFVKSL